jgi:mono/diheme cytochrome c family protein
MSRGNQQEPTSKNSSGPGGSAVSPSSGADALVREEGEPTAARAAVPVLLLALLGTLLYFADLSFLKHAGGFNALVYYPFPSLEAVKSANPQSGDELIKIAGKKTFDLACVACHQGTGQGLAGQFPPLAGSDWLVTEGANRPIRIVLNGLSGPIDVKGVQFNNAMPPWKDTLSDEQIAAVLTYVRNEWGNKAPAVTPEQVKKIRALISDRGDPWTATELKSVAEKD